MLLPNHAVNIQTAHCLLCCCQDKQLHIKHCLSDFAMLSVWFHGPVAHKPRARIHTAAHIHGWSYPDYHINAHIQSSNPKLISTAAHINSWSYHQLLISISKRLKCYTISMCCIFSCHILVLNHHHRHHHDCHHRLQIPAHIQGCHHCHCHHHHHRRHHDCHHNHHCTSSSMSITLYPSVI